MNTIDYIRGFRFVVDAEFSQEFYIDWLETATGCRCIGIVIKGEK